MSLPIVDGPGTEETRAAVRAELGRVGIDYNGATDPHASLGRFKFNRRWRYWRIEGAVPLAVAQELYAHPVGRAGVRVFGDAGAPPPETWARDHGAGLAVHRYDIDTREGLRLFVDTLRKHGLAGAIVAATALP